MWPNVIQGDFLTQLSSAIRAVLVALTVAGTALATAAYADSGSIRFNVIKAGFVIGGSAGSGTLVFHGRRYPLSIGGVSYGFTFGGSATDFVGTVTNIRRPTDVNGVYGAAGAGVAIGPGAGAIVLTNQNGAVLRLAGRQAGLIVAADLNGLVISLR
jgi:lipid-binding SYLF domain-containing protein